MAVVAWGTEPLDSTAVSSFDLMLSANLVWAVSRQGKGERGVIYTDMKERVTHDGPDA
jgi:hypothetical protein